MTFQYLPPAIATGLMLALLAPPAAANTPKQIFVQVSPSVMVVDIFDAKGKAIGQGSGVVIGAGQVITNCQIAQKGKSLQVRQSGKTFKATLQYVDPDRDLCQLSVPDLKAPPVTLGTAKKLSVGQRVYAIGAPQGLELTLRAGLISSLRPYEGSQYIQTSAAISPGSSGGGLFDDQGQLVGITSFQFIEGQNLNALPVDWIGELPKRAQAMPVVKTVAKTVAKKSGLARINRAIALKEKEDWWGLLKLSQQWAKSEPNNTVAWSNMGIAYSNLKQYDQAIQAYREVLRIQPENAGAWYSLAEVLRIDPEDSAAWYNLGNIYVKLDQHDHAIQAYREALRIQPEKATAWYDLGFAYYFKGQRDKVREIYPILHTLDPVLADKYFNLLGLP